MWYSRSWMTEDERRQSEAKAKEAEAKRSETIKAMLTDAEKQAMQSDACKARESAPAKGRMLCEFPVWSQPNPADPLLTLDLVRPDARPPPLPNEPPGCGDRRCSDA